MTKYEDTILLQLHRQFSKDEAVKQLLEEISKLKFTIGEMKSEVDEAKDEVIKLKASPDHVPKEWTMDDYVKELKTKYKAMKEERNKAIVAIKFWEDRYYEEVAKAIIKTKEG